jgi:tRNA pseudouridine55 synthase
VLPLVVGRATRLARFIGGDKTYDAVIRLGVNTDTYDALGQPVGIPFQGPWPALEGIAAALGRFQGTFLQQPPAFSAKKIAGQRSYQLARQARAGSPPSADDAAEPVLPAPMAVTAHAVDILDAADDVVRLRVRCSAGFYVRSLAHDLGSALGTGAHLVELRRIEAAGAGLDRAVPLHVLLAQGGREAGIGAMIPMEQMLSALPSVALTDDGVAHVRFGRNLGPSDATSGFADAVSATQGEAGCHVRLLDAAGHLVALAEAAQAPGLLHPAVVLM